MIKSGLKLKHSIDLSNFSNWLAFLKRLSKMDYVPQKSSFLAYDEMTKFMTEALDKQWLLTKHVLVFGILGA